MKRIKHIPIKSVLIEKITEMDNKGMQSVFEECGRIYTFLNPVSYLSALENKDLFCQFDGIFTDGSILVAAIRLIYGKTVIRRSFDMTSVASDLLSYAEQREKSVYFVASRQEQIERAASIFKERYPRLIMAGYRNGYFISEEEQEQEEEKIVSINPHFLIVGMGILAQENFLLKVKKAGFKGIGFTCGGFIHQTSKNEIDYYPAWIDRTNLRFLYRMYKEPHTRKRYLQAAFLFPVKFLAEERFF